MGGHGKPSCFVCLKSISQNHNDRVNDSELFRKFAGVLSGYLQLSSLSSHGGSTGDSENVSIFCVQCISMISNACDVYKEFRAIEVHLSKQLGELGELMMGEKKMSEGLSNSFKETLTRLEIRVSGRIPGYVEKVRNVVALKCALKGREIELEHDHRPLENKKTVNVEEGYHAEKEIHYIKVELESDADDSPMEGGFDDDRSEQSFPNDSDTVQVKQMGGDKNVENSELSSVSSSSHSSDSEFVEHSSSTRKPRKKKLHKKAIHPSQESAIGGIRKKLEGVKAKSKAGQGVDNDVECNCNLCGMPFENMVLFGRHLLIHEDREPLKNIACHYCWMSFALPQSYDNHLKTRHSDKAELKFCCDNEQCEELSFGSTEELNEHLKTHSEEVHICIKCNWGFLDFGMLELHRLIHLKSVRGNFPCPKCTCILHGFPKLRDHYNIRHGANMALYKCPKCSVSCVTTSNLKTHLKSHLKTHENGNQSKPPHSMYPTLSCGKCDVTFPGSVKGKERLRVHMKTMHSEVKHPCPVCQEIFISERAMERHMKQTHQTTRMSCKFCNKECASRVSLKKHIATIHPSNPEEHLCQYCGNVFSNRQYVLQHIRVVHKELFEGQGKNVCLNCGEKFHILGLLKKHSKTCQSKPAAGGVEDNIGVNELAPVHEQKLVKCFSLAELILTRRESSYLHHPTNIHQDFCVINSKHAMGDSREAGEPVTGQPERGPLMNKVKDVQSSDVQLDPTINLQGEKCGGVMNGSGRPPLSSDPCCASCVYSWWYCGGMSDGRLCCGDCAGCDLSGCDCSGCDCAGGC
ncbi:putative zinc finger protein [Orchesella cincta]|uniref:Putative zinc finger protein n=1 Tax=Orchesella cincta TaxID=48709 RepID=A0A1D2ML38_ORCCI|nr:putative zinc finger protein [Orchesella cincta]